MRTAEEIRATAKSVRERAATVLDKAEIDLAAALDEEREAQEALAAEEAKSRALKMAGRVEAARAKAGTAHLVLGVDLVALFPLGSAPPAAQLPGGGVIVIRNPTPDAVDTVNREVEAKQKSVASIMSALLASCVIDPDPMGGDGVTLGEFCRVYPDAAGQAAQKARELGGAKSAADKRGR